MLIRLTDMYHYPETNDIILNTDHIVSVEPSFRYDGCCDVVVPSPAKPGYTTFTVKGTASEIYDMIQSLEPSTAV